MAKHDVLVQQNLGPMVVEDYHSITWGVIRVTSVSESLLWEPWQTVTAAATNLWALRVADEFMKKAPPRSPIKQKET